MFRRVFLLLALEVAFSCLSGTAHAQAANSGETCGLFGCAVSATLRAHATANNWTASEVNDEIARMDAQVKADDTYKANCGGTSCGWFTWMWQKLAQGLQYGSGVRNDPLGRFPNADQCSGAIGTCTGGAGASGSWTNSRAPDCSQYKHHTDLYGREYIPALPLAGGGPFVKADSGHLKAFTLVGDNTTGWLVDQPAAAALWIIHNYNKTIPKPTWWGVWGISSTNGTPYWNFCSPREMVGGAPQGGVCSSAGNYSVDPYYGGPSDPDCPPGGAASGSQFDFYGKAPDGNHITTCVEYAPNSAIGVGGYAYPVETVLPQGYQLGFPNQPGIPSIHTACPISTAAIAAATQNLMDRASAAGGKANPGTIQPAEVKTGCTAPQIADMADPVGVPANTNCNSDPPATTTQPPPSTSPGGGGSTPSSGSGTITGDDPGITASDPTSPTNIMDPIFNWMPHLPQLTLNTSGATCPTWNVDMTSFGGPSWHWMMDAQCTLSESVRSALSALMVVIWGLGAAVVILRA